MKRIFFGILCIFCLTLNCVDEIEVEVERGLERALVIQGKLIYGDPALVQVAVSNLFDFTSNALRSVVVSSVEIINEEGARIPLQGTEIGVYELKIPLDNPSFPIEMRRSYKVAVITHDGRKYESTLETLNPVSKPKRIHFATIEKEVEGPTGFRKKKYFEFSIDSELTPQGHQENSRLLWLSEYTFRVTDLGLRGDGSCGNERGVISRTCYVTESADRTDVRLIDGTEFDHGSSIEGIALYEIDFFEKFSEGLYFTVFQESLSREAFDYWSQVQQSINRTGNMFEPVVGRVITNFYNPDDPRDPIFGYFYATQVDTIRKYISPEMAGFPDPRCPPPFPICDFFRCTDLLCCNCLDAPRSQVEKPEWWKE